MSSSLDIETNARRKLFAQGLTSVFSWIVVPVMSHAVAAATTTPSTPSERSIQREKLRNELLHAIQESKSSDSEIIKIIQELIPLNPEQEYYASLSSSSTKPSSSLSSSLLDGLDGEWKLIWSINDDFSPLLRLPYPFKPQSYQYFGSSAVNQVGEGRVAQGLTGGILGNNRQLWLSSGIDVLDDSQGVIEIEPPFRLELGRATTTTSSSGTRSSTGPTFAPKKKLLLVEAGNDETFRKINARNKEAQLAPKNIYQQLYLERNGSGSLRISSIVDGDPVIVGAILIHVKL